MGSVAISGDRRRLWRSRWAAIGAAVAVTLGGGGIFVANAASSVPASVVTIDPVRILDTRTDVGLAGPFVSAVSQKLQVTGAAVPAGATGVLLNVTVVSPTANGFLSVRPGDAAGAASTSSLNFNAGDIVSNSVQVGLPAVGANAGMIDITYDAYGVAGPTTEVLIDVVGYMVAGAAGSAGPAGATGATGLAGPRGYSAWDTIPAGVTVTGGFVYDESNTATGADHYEFVEFPAKAPVGVTAVNFAPDASVYTTDDDAACTGTQSAPTAPAGKVCIYLYLSFGTNNIVGLASTGSGIPTTYGFQIKFIEAGVSGDLYVYATWAYTAG